MPKNTTGGKKFKKVKHTMEFTRPLELPNPDENQEIAYVNKIMGGPCLRSSLYTYRILSEETL